MKPIVFTFHARQRMKDRGTDEEHIIEAIRLLLRRIESVEITYDKEVDALYIRLLAGEHQCRVVRLTEDIALDFTQGERLVGIEVLGASRLFETPDRPVVVLKDLLPQVLGERPQAEPAHISA